MGESGFDKSLLQFDFETNSFKERKKMFVARRLFGTTFMNGSIYVVGGETMECKSSSLCERYDISRKKWFKIANLNEGS